MSHKRICVLSLFIFGTLIAFSQQKIEINLNYTGRIYEGIGALSAGASSKLLIDYTPEIQSQIFDFLFKPKFGASLQHIKVEIGGDINSTDGTEPSHAHSRNEFLNPKPEYFQRGYEWMVLKEAKKRNPGIFLDCLEWGCPGWIGDGVFYSQDNADYIVSFLKGAKKYHGIDFDFTGIWNERPYNTEWIKLLRRTLNSNGLTDIKIIAADVFDWNIAIDMQNDNELYDAVYALGIHYNEQWKANPYSSTEVAKSLNKSLRNSEGGPWKGDWDGFEYLVKLYNRNYIVGKATNVITWSLITSYYDNLSLPNSGLMIAKTPWSGHYEVQPGIWAAAHTTQFTEPGWKYVDSGCGLLKKGSYVTLKSPDEKDFSIIIETVDTTGTQTVTFQLTGNFSNKPLHVWKSTRENCEFERQPDLKVRNNKFTIKLEGKSAYSITTTTGQTKGNYPVPEDKPFPFPFRTDFENETIGQLPKYFMDQAGVFEVHQRQDGRGKCLKQVITQQGTEWEVGQNVFVSTILGDTLWTDYEVLADVNILENTGYAKLLGRVTEVRRGGDYPDGYWFKINTSGNWVLFAGDQKISSGRIDFPPFIWHQLSMKFKDNTISVSVNNKEVVSVSDTKFTHGLAGIGSDFDYVEFDNFEVK
jgi:galactosylceramidase